jgi:hypothetical protein
MPTGTTCWFCQWKDRRVSYDLAVWEGKSPSDDQAAGEMFASLYERYVESDDPQPPSEVASRAVVEIGAREALLVG